MSSSTVVQEIAQQIYFVRRHRVMLDADLAELYGVELRALNQAVRRNPDRFPDDFMFQLTAAEFDSIRSQSVILKTGRGRHRKYLPLVFTEQGVSMLSSVLKSKRAIQVNVAIMRTFVKLREMLESHKDLAQQLEKLERKFLQHDKKFEAVFEAIRQLMTTGLPTTQKRIKGLGK
jgi:hypothetical protein